MPLFSEYVANKNPDKPRLLRELIYGPPKTKKTWWACTAAQAGFNVLLLDGDRGCEIVKQLSLDAQRRVYVIDTSDEPKRACFAHFIAYVGKFGAFGWHEQRKQRSQHPQSGYTWFDFNKLDNNWVVVLDSVTSLAESAMIEYANNNNIDLSDADEIRRDVRKFFGWTGTFMIWAINELRKLPCHLIVIGHQTVYEKTKQDPFNPKRQIIEWTRTQIISTSGPNAQHLAASSWDDIIRTYKQGSDFYLRIRADADADGGSRHMPDRDFKWQDLPVDELCKIASIPLPANDLPYPSFSGLASAKQAAKQTTQTIQTATATLPATPRAAPSSALMAALKKE